MPYLLCLHFWLNDVADLDQLVPVCPAAAAGRIAPDLPHEVFGQSFVDFRLRNYVRVDDEAVEVDSLGKIRANS